jgi:hypothetical protein
MNSEEITAVITGIFVILGALVAGYYQLRAARVGRSTSETPGPQLPITVTPPREATGLKREVSDSGWPAVGPPPGAAGRDDQSLGVPGPTVASPAGPTQRVLPLVHPDQMYQGLGHPELDAKFITDIQFTLKEGDRFIFDDGSEEPR